MPQLPQLDLHLYASLATPDRCQPRLVDGIELNCVDVVDVDQSQMPSSFESVGERLARLDRMFFELDGSFVCTGEDAGQRWQLDGMLYDRQGRVQRLELLGQCPLSIWHNILDALRTAPTPAPNLASPSPADGGERPRLVAHLRRQGCFVTTEELERLWCETQHEH